MNKTLRIVSACLIVTFMLLTLVACSPSEDDVVGKYTGTYEYNGNTFYRIIILDDDGNYSTVTMKNGELSSTDEGEYGIEGNKVRLYDSDSYTYHGSYIEYKYRNDTLINNNRKFVKE